MDERLVAIMDETTPRVVLRPMVKKYLPQYQRGLVEHGPEIVRGVLTSKEGKYKGFRRWPTLNSKDCHQLIQLLGLTGGAHAADK